MLQYSSPHQLVDSLLEQFNDYQVDWSDISTYPYVCLQDYHYPRCQGALRVVGSIPCCCQRWVFLALSTLYRLGEIVTAAMNGMPL